MKLADLTAFLFPARTILERELEWTKQQLAAANRRADVLQDELLSLKRPHFITRIPAKSAESTPKGWDATRAAERKSRDTRETESEKFPPGSPAGSIAAIADDWAETNPESLS